MTRRCGLSGKVYMEESILKKETQWSVKIDGVQRSQISPIG